ncbi:hypothetical protein F5X96DRAFT_678309 [Biscogniauxia mediterranea]|nr:hypothetical protein F5X96DRAFT_678309 [Biscogniauxia mediterranea]
MSCLSRGCLRCRQRRVKCDQGRPACQRCVDRDEICEDSRDEASTYHRRAGVRRCARWHCRGRHRYSALAQITAMAQPDTRSSETNMFFTRAVKSSSPGFLEHLPSLFQDANRRGTLSPCAGRARMTTRWLLRHSISINMSLSALRISLSAPGKVPDDHDFMTVVILDIFEVTPLGHSCPLGAHAQGMAQIPRLRGHEQQLYNARGWSLFRLIHHCVQKQQLVFGLKPLDESEDWIDRLDDDMPFVHLENDELRKLDQEAVSWREGPRWSFKTLAARDLPSTQDIWMAYGWNYHRTAKIVAHGQVLECINTALAPPDLDNATIETLSALLQESTAIIRALADEILSIMPQSLGDIDHPTKVKETQSSMKTQQRQKSQVVFERIREYTGMKSHLGEMSTI